MQTVQDFQNGVASLLADVEQHLRAEQPSLHLEPIFLAPARHETSHAAVASSVAFAILDVTHEDEDSAFLVGLVQGARIPHVLSPPRRSRPQLHPRQRWNSLQVPQSSVHYGPTSKESYPAGRHSGPNIGRTHLRGLVSPRHKHHMDSMPANSRTGRIRGSLRAQITRISTI